MWHGRFKQDTAEAVKILKPMELLNPDEAEKYDYADDDDVMKISSRLIKKHRKAYISLANA